MSDTIYDFDLLSYLQPVTKILPEYLDASGKAICAYCGDPATNVYEEVNPDSDELYLYFEPACEAHRPTSPFIDVEDL